MLLKRDMRTHSTELGMEKMNENLGLTDLNI